MSRNRIPKRRQPYGHRADSFTLIDDPSIVALNADWFPLAYNLPMPRTRGRDRGVRSLVACPRCGRKVKTLYRPVGADFWWCRHCWGLRYPSQYQGRRPEAAPPGHPERLEALLESAFRARSPQVRMRRLARLDEAIATRDRHELAYLGRFGASLDDFLAGIAREKLT